jgi:hypothetical protein
MRRVSMLIASAAFQRRSALASANSGTPKFGRLYRLGIHADWSKVIAW